MNWLVLILFAVVTCLHFLSLHLQAKSKIFTKRFGTNGFLVHFLITALLWITVVLAFTQVKPDSQIQLLSIPNHHLLGWIVKIVGIGMFIWASIILGWKRMWGIRFFQAYQKNELERSGPYRWLENPIYDGFFIYFIGKGIEIGSLFFLITAVESFMLLNIFLARFENKKLKVS